MRNTEHAFSLDSHWRNGRELMNLIYEAASCYGFECAKTCSGMGLEFAAWKMQRYIRFSRE
jgi:hypothetical protein